MIIKHVCQAAVMAILAVAVAGQAQAANPKAIVRDALAAIFVDFDAKAVRRLLSENYIQHNPNVPTGRAPIIGFLPKLKASAISLKTHRILAEDDIVVTHNSYTNAQLFGAKDIVTFDVFRVADGKVVEHWDNIAQQAPPNPSGRTQTDGPTKIVDLDKTAANKKLVTDFVNTVLVNGDTSSLTSFINPKRYHQHNTAIADGLDGLGAALKAMAEKGIEMRYTKVHMVVAEGNFVFTMSEGVFGGKPTAFFDLFRVDNGKMVEHWDILSNIPDKMAHNNGKF